jgi:hypothetical protein
MPAIMDPTDAVADHADVDSAVRGFSGEAAPARPPASSVGPDQGVIEEARRRQRRRRVFLAGTIFAAIAAGLAVDLGGSDRSPGPGRSAPRAAATPSGLRSPREVFSRPPYLGVACGMPNLVVCDRVGLAVWLRRPAVAVRATIAGRPVKLDDPGWSGPIHDGRRRLFAGFLQPAGVAGQVTPNAAGLWFGTGAPSPTIRVWIGHGHGRVVSTQTTAQLSAGWG